LHFDGSARLRRHDEERLVEFDAGDRTGIGGVEHDQAVAAGEAPQHLGPEGRAAHAEQDDLCVLDGRRPGLQVVGLRSHALDDGQPSEAVGGDIALWPKCRVAGAQPVKQ
jgi:hypothetical protein